MTFLPPVTTPIKVAPKTALLDIKITSPDGRGSTTGLEIDGKPCINAHAVKFEVTADNWAAAEIRFIPNAFTYEGQSAVSIDEATAELLVKLGWTPPEGA